MPAATNIIEHETHLFLYFSLFIFLNECKLSHNWSLTKPRPPQLLLLRSLLKKTKKQNNRSLISQNKIKTGFSFLAECREHKTTLMLHTFQWFQLTLVLKENNVKVPDKTYTNSLFAKIMASTSSASLKSTESINMQIEFISCWTTDVSYLSCLCTLFILQCWV